MITDHTHIKVTFDDVPAFLAARTQLDRNAHRLSIDCHSEYMMHDTPKWGLGGIMRSPGKIFLTPEGYETTKALWVGIIHHAELVSV